MPIFELPPRSIVYGLRRFEDEMKMYMGEDEIQAVVAKIENIYSRANLDKVTLGLDDGYSCCLGLLDPVANIRVNGVIHDAAAAAAPPPPPAPSRGSEAGIARRSLDGLVAFLTCIFPYLPDAEALAYLDAADADPLVAALLIISRRGMRRFGFSSATTVAAVEAALRCAAVAAQHPDPQRFVLGWKSLSSSLTKFAGDLSGSVAAPDFNAVNRVARLIQTAPQDDAHLELQESWELARCRLQLARLVPMGRDRDQLPPVRAAAKRMLLATIHRFYLQALARLPTAELRSRYHRGVLKGGSCYGPLDPVSNIIVNTVWYEQTFPARKHVTLDMISTSSLWRAAARSLYGLVSFLCTRYQNLTLDQALQRLLETGANLQDADPYLFATPVHKQCRAIETEETAPSVTVREAYAAAATAAFHPNPLAQTEFLGSPDTVANLEAASKVLHLQDGRMLSSKDLELLCMSIFDFPSSAGILQAEQPEPEPKKVNVVLYAHVSECELVFWGQHYRAKRMVAAALSKFNETVEHHYKLHVICGVNEYVSYPDFSGAEYGSYDPCARNKYLHSHINFLATREGEHTTLFFAECENPYTGFFAECENRGTGSWCAPVSLPQRNAEENAEQKAGVNPDAATDPYAEQVRCIYCEHQENRIVHPAVSGFHGRDNFAELFYPSNESTRYYFSNNKAIRKGDVDWVNDLEDDNIYVNVVPGEAEPGDELLLRSRIF